MAIFLSRIKRALNVGSKNITANGTYYASADGYDGYDEVTVNVSGGSATPITPSNANPVALSSGVAVEPTANGYAIQSYDNITPPSSPQAISSGDILKMIGNGYVIDTYSNVTPSDSTPPQLSQGYLYEPTANGYLYATEQPKIKIGTFTATSSQTTVDVGFQPKILYTQCINGAKTQYSISSYNENIDSSYIYSYWKTSAANSSKSSLGNTDNARINNITSTGFKFGVYSSAYSSTVYYVAIG